MARTKQSSIRPSEWERKRSWYDAMESEDAFKLFPGKEDDIKRAAYAFVEWAEKPTSLRVIDFYREKHICMDTWQKKVDKNPYLAKWFEFGKKLIASNRHNGAMWKRLSHESAMLGIGRLDPEIGQDLKEAAQLKKEAQPDSSEINIHQGKNAYNTERMGRPQVISPEELAEETEDIHKTKEIDAE